MEEISRKAIETFSRVFGAAPEFVAFAPGRVEVLGNHTDYNGGYVLSVALDIGVAVAAARIPGFAKFAEVYSDEFQETVKFAFDAIQPEPGSWSNYPRGVFRELDRAGMAFKGTRLAIVSNLPIGAGISSSAALELATAEALYGLYDSRPKDPMEEAKLCQRAEVDFVGVPCGLLDQFSSKFGKKNHALFLDCATLRHQEVYLGRDDLSIVLADSGEKHALVDGKYADLRASCERATAYFRERLGHEVRFLRDVSMGEVSELAEELDLEDRNRAEHVIRENERVLRGLAAIKSQSTDELRTLMLESHASSRDLFGNSTPALDFLVAVAAELPGFQGGKLTGGGFGGSTVNLVETSQTASFAKALTERFHAKYGRTPRTMIVGVGDGARVEPVSG
jgi:galactokinase